jgi:thiol-disulfide isomerase/thioredoxin
MRHVEFVTERLTQPTPLPGSYWAVRYQRGAVALLGACALIAGASACSSSPEKGAGGNYRFVQQAPGIDAVAVGNREAAPALSGQQVDGQPFDLASTRGSVTVVNFWASWCGPCRAETPNLESVVKQTAASGVRFVGVNVKDSRAAAASFMREKGVTYPSLYDDDGSLAARWPIAVGLPSTVVLDRQGRIAARFTAAVDSAQLLPVVQRVTAETS